jgi:hypothetical protein
MQLLRLPELVTGKTGPELWWNDPGFRLNPVRQVVSWVAEWCDAAKMSGLLGRVDAWYGGPLFLSEFPSHALRDDQHVIIEPHDRHMIRSYP